MNRISIFGSLLLLGAVSVQAQNAVSIDPLTGAARISATSGVNNLSVTISATPGAVATNVAVTVSWSTSGFTGALNCTRISSPFLSGWSGTSTLASGSTSVTMPSTPGQVSLTLNCTGSNGTASNFVNVMVTSDVGVDCSTRPPGVRGSPRILVNREFSSIWETDFPGIFGPTFLGSVNDGTVIAYAFVAPFDNTIEGYFQSVPSPETGGRGAAATGISECPGDISDAVPTCEPSFGKTRNEWTSTGRPGACNLIPGRQYYYNFSMETLCVFGPNPGLPGGVCSFRLESKRY